MTTRAAEKLRLIGKALDRLSPRGSDCTLCPRNCHVDRTREARGVCGTGQRAEVSHALLHYGEEPVLSGTGGPGPRGGGRSPSGSGTVFFSGCNLKCLFCQNYQLSWLREGRPVEDEELASLMLGLQERGALNINLVSPTHVVLPILRALRIATTQGLDIPLVWNSNGYDSLDVIRCLDGVVDIYLPDLKYHGEDIARRYSGAPDYFARAAEAVLEMSLQQPVLKLRADGTARRGLIIRHLVLPGHTEDSLEVLRWIGASLSPLIGLSLMSQYHPCHKAPEEIARTLRPEEYRPAMELALTLGLEHLFVQPEPFGPDEHLVPDFRKKEPFRWK